MQPQATNLQNSILGTHVRAISQALDAAGCDVPALLRRAGFRAEDLNGSEARCPLAAMGRLWRIALEATRDPAFGVKLAKYYTHTSFHALGFGLTASSTLKEAFERLQRFSNVVSDAVVYRFVRQDEEYHLHIEPTVLVPAECIDALVGTYLRMCRSLVGRHYSPLMIELQRARPEGVEYFQQQWRAPLTFNAALNRLSFDRASIEQHLMSGNPEVARHSDMICAQYLARIERLNTEARVRRILARRLPDSEPSQNEVAAMLNMTTRTLQRKLVQSGTTFKRILDDTRYSLALVYLGNPEIGISEIAALLGFSCISSFTRACRRWTGVSPHAWRGG